MSSFETSGAFPPISNASLTIVSFPNGEIPALTTGASNKSTAIKYENLEAPALCKKSNTALDVVSASFGCCR